MAAAAGAARGNDDVPLPESLLRQLFGPGIAPSFPNDAAVGPDVSSLEATTRALVRIAAVVAVGSSAPAYTSVVAEAGRAGVVVDDILRVLAGVGSVVGLARLVAAAPEIALALGYDIDAALEQLDRPDGSSEWSAP